LKDAEANLVGFCHAGNKQRDSHTLKLLVEYSCQIQKMCQKVELKEYLILLTFAVVSAAVHWVVLQSINGYKTQLSTP